MKGFFLLFNLTKIIVWLFVCSLISSLFIRNEYELAFHTAKESNEVQKLQLGHQLIPIAKEENFYRMEFDIVSSC